MKKSKMIAYSNILHPLDYKYKIIAYKIPYCDLSKNDIGVKIILGWLVCRDGRVAYVKHRFETKYGIYDPPIVKIPYSDVVRIPKRYKEFFKILNKMKKSLSYYTKKSRRNQLSNGS